MTFGIDAGYRNLGVGWYDPKLNKVNIYNYDLHVVNGKLYRLTRTHYMKLIPLIIQNWDCFMAHTRAIFIEDQVVPGEQKVVRTVKEIAIILGTALSMRYPAIPIIYVRPQTVRTYLKTKSVDYDARKMTSKELFFRLISDEDKALVEQTFYKKEDHKFHVDPIEAALFAIYGAYKIREFSVNHLPDRVGRGKNHRAQVSMLVQLQGPPVGNKMPPVIETDDDLFPSLKNETEVEITDVTEDNYDEELFKEDSDIEMIEEEEEPKVVVERKQESACAAKQKKDKKRCISLIEEDDDEATPVSSKKRRANVVFEDEEAQEEEDNEDDIENVFSIEYIAPKPPTLSSSSMSIPVNVRLRQTCVSKNTQNTQNTKRK